MKAIVFGWVNVGTGVKFFLLIKYDALLKIMESFSGKTNDFLMCWDISLIIDLRKNHVLLRFVLYNEGDGYLVKNIIKKKKISPCRDLNAGPLPFCHFILNDETYQGNALPLGHRGKMRGKGVEPSNPLRNRISSNHNNWCPIMELVLSFAELVNSPAHLARLCYPRIPERRCSIF